MNCALWFVDEQIVVLEKDGFLLEDDRLGQKKDMARALKL